MLGELEDTDLQWLVDAGEGKRFAAGEKLAVEGAPAPDLQIVVSGEVSVTRGAREIERRGAGEVVGVMSFIDRRPAPASVTALEDVHSYTIPRRALRSKLREDPPFAARLYRALALLLVHRLVQAHAMAAEEEGSTDSLGDEMSDATLELVSRAGIRFEWFLQRVRSD
jgi:CRP-like cAMP-binding protein